VNRCFVIGPIGDKMAAHGSPRRLAYEEALSVYEDVIKPACAENDLEPIRADGIAVPGEITDQIFRHLLEDEVVIADVSGANPNVMYELGLRHTTGLLTIQIGEYGQLPFDVQALRTIMFSRSERGLIDARKQLSEVLRIGLAEGTDPLPATRVWQSRAGGPIPSRTTEDNEETSPQTEDVAEDERGFVDRMAEIEDDFPILNSTVEELGGVLETLGAQAADFGSEIEAISESASAAQRLTVLTRYGKSLQQPADDLTRLTSTFAGTMAGLDENVRGLLNDMARDPELLRDENVSPFLEGIAELASGTREGMEGLNEFATMVGSLGKISRALKRPGQQMERAIRAMAKSAALVDDWESAAVALLRARDTAKALATEVVDANAESS
jgi:hypothetical protein